MDTSNMIFYKDCYIDDKFFIWSKSGLPLFRRYWQLAHNLEDAKLTIDMSDVAKSLHKHPDQVVKNAVLAYDFHDAEKELEEQREAERINDYYERLNDEKWGI